MTNLPENGVEVSVLPQPKEDEIVLLRYNMDVFDFDEIFDIHKNAEKWFAPNDVLTIPDAVTLSYCDIDELTEIRDWLTKIIDSFGQE